MADTTAVYAEMVRYIEEGISAARGRDIAAQLDLFRRATDLAVQADLGADVVVGTRRNLALALREAGRLEEAAEIYRELLADAALSEGQKPFVLHGLGLTLALAGRSEATEYLHEALQSYTKRKDILQAVLDLAASWLQHCDARMAYGACSEYLSAEDKGGLPDLYCQVQIAMAQALLAEGSPERARAHLKEAEAVRVKEGLTWLRPWLRAVAAECEYLAGDPLRARTDLLLALEEAIGSAEESEAANLCRKVALIVTRVLQSNEAKRDGG